MSERKERRSVSRQMAESAILLLAARAAQVILPILALWIGNAVHDLELAAERVKVEMTQLEQKVTQLDRRVFRIP